MSKSAAFELTKKRFRWIFLPMDRQQIVGCFTAIQGAGLIGTFTYLDGIRLLDGAFFTAVIWIAIVAGLCMLLGGLGYAAASDEF